jgi:hypothetical protein
MGGEVNIWNMERVVEVIENMIKPSSDESDADIEVSLTFEFRQ